MKKACLLILAGILLIGVSLASAAEMAKETLTPAALIAKLTESKTEKERFEIVAEIAKLGAAAVPELREALKHRNWRVQWGAAVALGTIQDKGSAPALIELLKTGTDPGIRGAAQALAMLKEQSAVPHLLQAMQGLNAASAIEALGLIGDPGAAILLTRVMDDAKDNDVKRVAAEALGRLKDPMAIPSLIEGLKSGSWQVQAPSRWALVQIGKPAVPDLIGLLSVELGDAPRLAAEALGELKEPTAVKPLLAVLKNMKNVPARIAAADALGEVGDSSSIIPLIEAYEDMGEYTVEFVWKGVRVSAAESVAKMSKDSLSILLEKL
ncbi:MAG: HEAT repeat domain-containing protein, partial [Nitrospirota bacterium]|nr:HEAT repeat domain-containing protein [Nitrospirota bacterium]